MMNSSVGEPNLASESARRDGGTWLCGETSGSFPTSAYRVRATSRCAGSGEKPRSGGSVQGIVCIDLLRLSRVDSVPVLDPELAQDLHGHLGLARTGEDALHIQSSNPHGALDRSKVGVVPNLHANHEVLTRRDL